MRSKRKVVLAVDSISAGKSTRKYDEQQPLNFAALLQFDLYIENQTGGLL